MDAILQEELSELAQFTEVGTDRTNFPLPNLLYFAQIF